MILHDFVSISGGKDSTATMCLAVERAATHPRFKPRFQFCQVDNENEVTEEHVDYLEVFLKRELGATIERLSAYDVPGLIDAEAFERKRRSIRQNWPKELRRKRHSTACKDRFKSLPQTAPGCRHSPERAAAIRLLAERCDLECPTIVSPPVPDWRIEQAIAALEPSGNAFLDLCLIHGRFPSKKAKFCTEELKLLPLEMTRIPIWEAGGVTVDWIGERADESKDRAKKPVLERHRMGAGTKVLYRPIHGWSARDTFVIAKRHGLKPNPLYLLGCGRVGCWPCINAQKGEVRIIARHTPEKIITLAEWERRVSLVSRRDAGGDGEYATFFSADKVPGDPADWARASIHKVVAWSQTTHGGRQFDLMQRLFEDEENEDGFSCSSQYGLCE